MIPGGKGSRGGDGELPLMLWGAWDSAESPGAPASGVSRSCFPAASTERFSGSQKILMPLTTVKNPTKTPLLEKAFWKRNVLLYQVFRCSNSTLSSKGTECDRGRGQTLLHHTNRCPFHLRLDSAETAWGEGYENTAWSKGTRPRLGVGSEKVSHETSV